MFYSAYQWNSYQWNAYQIARAAQTVQPSGGSGYAVYGKYIRPKGISEFLDVAMSEIYEALTKSDIKIETKQSVINLVRPYTDSKRKIPEISKIDWLAFEKDIERVDALLRLWEQQLEDEDIVLLTYLHYLH